MKRKLLNLKYKKNEKGFVLVTILMILFIVSILGIGLLSVSTSNFKQIGSERDFQAVYYIAESGINRAIYDVGKEVDDLSNESLSHEEFFEYLNSFIDIYMDGGGKIVNEFEESFGEKPVATISIELVDPGLVIEDDVQQTKATTEYLIKSVGKIGNLNRAVRSTIKVAHGIAKETESSHHPAFDYALYSASNRTFKNAGGAKINGSVYAHDIEFDATNTIIDGDIISEKSINLKSAVNVKGNIYAMDGFVKLSNSDIEMKGDIHATEDVTLSHGTIVDGNIYTNRSVTLHSSNAKVTGDIHAGGNTTLGSNASVKNIYTKGNIILESSTKVENIFTSGSTTLNSSNTVNGDIHSIGNVTISSGANTKNIYTEGSTTLGSNNTINGDIHSVASLVFNGSAEVKNIFTKGNVYFSGWGPIINGDIHAAGDVGHNTDSGGVTVNGSIFSGREVVTGNYKTFKFMGDINAASNVENGNDNIINGNVISGRDVTNRGRIHGTTIENGNPVKPFSPISPTLAMKKPTQPQFDTFKSMNSEVPLHSFEIGANNIVGNQNSATHDILPGFYNNLITKWNDTINFSSGNYYFNNINAENSAIKLQLDLSNGPINIYAKGNIYFASGLDVSVSQDGVNYRRIEELIKNDLDLAIKLAGQVYWESHANYKIAENCYFLGSILANNNLTTSSSTTLVGAYAVNKGTISMGYGPVVIYAPPTDSAAGGSGGSDGTNEDGDGENNISPEDRITTSSPIRENK